MERNRSLTLLNEDLIINTAELTVEDATEVVLSALQRKLACHSKEKVLPDPWQPRGKV